MRPTVASRLNSIVELNRYAVETCEENLCSGRRRPSGRLAEKAGWECREGQHFSRCELNHTFPKGRATATPAHPPVIRMPPPSGRFSPTGFIRREPGILPCHFWRTSRATRSSRRRSPAKFPPGSRSQRSGWLAMSTSRGPWWPWRTSSPISWHLPSSTLERSSSQPRATGQAMHRY